jgi:hypothetical protein
MEVLIVFVLPVSPLLSIMKEKKSAKTLTNAVTSVVMILTQGSYKCQCVDGFTGSGYSNQCFDIDECLIDQTSCHKHSQCINYLGTFKCICNEGFYGNGIFCESKNHNFNFKTKTKNKKN